MSKDFKQESLFSKGPVEVGPQHTRIPNLLLDLVVPRLSHAEQACLLYILRHTYGFAEGAPHQRKQWDRIALSQFISGNSSGDYVIDLGTGLSRASNIKALSELEQKGLVRVSYECPTFIDKQGKLKGCGWSQMEDESMTTPKIDPKTQAHRCPRCGRTLAKAYALRILTPGFVKRFLNATDPTGREWHYDPNLGRFYTGEVKQEAKEVKLPDPELLKEKLWYPEKVEKILEDASSVLKGGQVSDSRKVKGFYQPVLELQEAGFEKEAVKFALDTVIQKKIAAQSNNKSWHRYAKVCAVGWTERNYGSMAKAEEAQAKRSLEAELKTCAQLNFEHKGSEARELLKDILSVFLEEAANREFGGDQAVARRHILEAFKRGLDDYISVRDYTVATDYLPEWSWEADESK